MSRLVLLSSAMVVVSSLVSVRIFSQSTPKKLDGGVTAQQEGPQDAQSQFHLRLKYGRGVGVPLDSAAAGETLSQVC